MSEDAFNKTQEYANFMGCDIELMRLTRNIYVLVDTKSSFYSCTGNLDQFKYNGVTEG